MAPQLMITDESAINPTYRITIRNAVDMALLGKRPTLLELIKALEKHGIHTALRTNEAGMVYGITYVDHQTKSVFNGSALGKQYSAKAIQERCVSEPDLLSHPAQKPIGLQPQATASAAETKAHRNDRQIASTSKGTETILDALMQPEQAPDYGSGQFKKNKKKRKRKNLNNNQ